VTTQKIKSSQSNKLPGKNLRNKHLLIRIIEHRLSGTALTVLGLILVFLLFVVITNFHNLIYPEKNLNKESPKQYVQQKSKLLPSNVSKPEVIEHGSRYKHQVAITFDADMTKGMLILLQKGIVKSWYNQSIIDTLHQNNVKATLFLTGLWVKTYPKEANSLAHDPLFEIGNHSFDHPAFTPNCYRLPFIDNSKDQDEVESAQKIIEQTTGVTPKYFRFPGGCFDNVDLLAVAKLGLKIVHWDVVSGDAFNKDPNTIVSRVLSRVQNGSIVVFHMQGGTYSPKTNEALVKIIPALKKQGYQFVTVSELLSGN
jgi:peptidoglycan/xylan/chitin deacetylase (PgdA/CDA1 family)